MTWIISGALLLTLAAAAALQFWAHMRTLDAFTDADAPPVNTDRYRPMLRLLSAEDIELTDNPALRRKLRAQRCDIFRGYLRLLAEDYGKSLSGLRLMATESCTDRPDLAKALLRNQILFAAGLCRIDIRLRLYAYGISSPDVLRRDVLELVDSLTVLRGQFTYVESAVWGE
jgi:hypothetical protein